jgi:TonB-linked SusC/RagA family outer membrane protein
MNLNYIMKKLLQSLFILMLLAGTAFAQNRTVSGTVLGDEDGQPLPGVTVRVVGARGGTQTNTAGKFTLSVPAGATALEFAYLGYLQKMVPFTSGNVYNVRLASDSQGLNEVVVTGYGTTSKARQTGSVGTVDTKALEQTPFTSVDKALQGRVAGVQSVGASGQPGAAQSIRIRGLGSILGSSEPLFVVDGIPINSGDLSRNTTSANALAGINPNDIESMTVLKDASSTAIYGSRGANGVVLITTKSGKMGKTKVRLDAEYGFIKPGTYNDNTRPLTTEENILLIGESLLNSPSYVSTYSLTPANIRAFVTGPNGFGINADQNTDWYDVVTRTGAQKQYNVSADGGNDRTTFHVGGGYFSQEGTVPRSGFNRYSANINLKHKYNEKLSFGTNILMSSSKTQGLLNAGAFGNPVLGSLFLMPDLAARNPDGSINIGGALAPGSGLYNPLQIIALDNQRNNTQKVIGSFNAEYKILPNLKISTKYGIDYNNIEEDSYNNPTYGDGRSVGGRSYRDYTRYFNWVWTNLVDYRWNITKDDNLVANIKAGYEAQKSQYYTLSAASYNVPLNTNFQVPSVGATPITSAGTQDGFTFASLLAIGDISYKNKYVLSGSFRRDGSSRFGINNQYGNFWSVAGSWNGEQEDFIKELNAISQLKVRASYGVNGNAQGIGNNPWRTTYGYTRTTYNFVYNGAIGSGPNQYGVSSLTWEKSKSFDIGVDLGFFNNRLTTTVDFYNRQSDALLLNVPTSYTTGFASYINNFGGLKNNGFEVSLGGSPIRTKDFEWSLSFNISHNKNKVANLVIDKQVSAPFIRQVGQDYQSYFLVQYAGVNPDNGAAQWYTDDTRTTVTSTYAQAARVLLNKSAAPKAFGSIGTNFTYKGIGLDALLYYNFGNYIYNGFYQYQNSGGAYYGSYNQSATELDRWTTPGQITNTPKPVYGGTNSYAASDRLLYKGDYIRLRDVTLSYNLPISLIEKAKLSAVKVYARGSNLWTWTKDKNLPFDPEAAGTGGTNNFELFIPKTVTFGVNVSF